MVMATWIAAIKRSMTLSISILNRRDVQILEVCQYRGCRGTDRFGVLHDRSNQFLMTERIAFHESSIQIEKLKEAHLNLLNDREVE